jgi:hypothetical protein
VAQVVEREEDEVVVQEVEMVEDGEVVQVEG